MEKETKLYDCGHINYQILFRTFRYYLILNKFKRLA